jgi:hypothetical protein
MRSPARMIDNSGEKVLPCLFMVHLLGMLLFVSLFFNIGILRFPADYCQVVITYL